MTFFITNFRVRIVENDIRADYYTDYYKDFGTDHYAALDWYHRCGNAKETCGIPSIVSLEKQDKNGEWVVVFKREVFGWL